MSSTAAWSSRSASSFAARCPAHRKCYSRSHRFGGESMIPTLVILGFLLIFLVVSALKSFGINREYQRAVLFRLGRLGEMKGPGWYWLIPFVDRVVRVDTRIITYQLETQETITRDGVAVRVNAVLWFRAESPIQVVNSVENWMAATVQAAETALRDA